MMRGMTILWTGVAVVIGIGLFLLKYEVQSLEDRLSQVNRDIRGHQEAIHVLRAEWAYLDDPDRLRDLNDRHLALKPVRTDQLVAVADLPMAAPRPDAPPAPEVTPQEPAPDGRVMVETPAAPLTRTLVLKPEAPATVATAKAPAFKAETAKPIVVSRPEPVRSEALQSAFATAKATPKATSKPVATPASTPAPARTVRPAPAPVVVTRPAPVAPVVTSAPGADVFVIKSPALIAAEKAAAGGLR